MDSFIKSKLRDLALSTTITIAGSGNVLEIRGCCKGAEGVHFTLAEDTDFRHDKAPVMVMAVEIHRNRSCAPVRQDKKSISPTVAF